MSRHTQRRNGYQVAWGKDHAIGWFVDVVMDRTDLSVGQLTPIFQVEWGEQDWPEIQGTVRSIKHGFGDVYLIELTEPMRGQLAPAGSHIDAYDDDIFYKADRPVVSRATAWDGLTQVEMYAVLEKYGISE